MPGSDLISLSTGGVLATGTSRTCMMWLLAPSTTNFEIVEIYVSGKAAPTATSDIGIYWELTKLTDAGSGGTSLSPVKWPGGTGTDLGTSKSRTWSGEPTVTASSVYLDFLTPATAPGFTWRGSLLVPASTYMGIMATTPDDINVMCRFLYRRS